MGQIERLIYLATETRLTFSKSLERHIVPVGEVLNGIAQYGIEGYCLQNNIDSSRLLEQYQQGSISGGASVEEYRAIVAKNIVDSLNEQLAFEAIDYVKYLQLMQSVKNFTEGKREILQEESFEVFTNEDEPDFLSHKTNVIPFKNLFGEIENGFYLIGARSGTGKTRFVAATCLQLLEDNIIDTVEFHELEIATSRMKQITNRARPNFKVRPNQKFNIHAGFLGSVENLVAQYSDTNMRRAIVIDSPDIIANLEGSTDEVWSKIMTNLTLLSHKSAFLFVTSQLNRGQESTSAPTLNNLARTSYKEHYPDVILGLVPAENPFAKGSKKALTMNVLKSRNMPTIEDSTSFLLDFQALKTEVAPDYDESEVLRNMLLNKPKSENKESFDELW